MDLTDYTKTKMAANQPAISIDTTFRYRSMLIFFVSYIFVMNFN